MRLNFFFFYKKSFKNISKSFSLFSFRSDTSESCFSNDVLHGCDCNRNDFGYTIFYKIALNITALKIICKYLRNV